MRHLLFPSWLVAAVALGMVGALWTACDTGPGPVPLDQQQPAVSDLVVVPETIRASELPADRLSNGEATVDVTTVVTARDPDGTVDRVLVIIDPAYGTSSLALAQLPRIEGDRYGGTARYTLAADREDVFTVRAFAVDNDSLTSNQVVGQIHFLPTDSN